MSVQAPTLQRRRRQAGKHALPHNEAMRSLLSPPVVPTVLLTGFDAFGASAAAGPDVNPSWQAVSALDGETIAGHRVVAAQLPTVFGDSAAAMLDLVRRHRPALAIGVGQAGGRAAISLERIAINVDDARIPDNRGQQPIDRPVVAGGPDACFSTLPIKAMLLALQQAGLPAEVSQTAGTFVCNHVFYALMHALATEFSGQAIRGGFVHVPFLPEQGEPSMRPDEVMRGLRVAVAAALATRHDIARGAGALN